MLASVEIGKSKFWIEFVIRTRKRIKEYHYDDSTRIIEIERRPEDVLILGVTRHEDFVREVLREIEYLFVVEDLSRDEVLEKIKDIFGLNDEDAKELLDYAEWYLFNG
ncbi:hypothetical protein [Archaeoglobus sp.]